jgi:hypothetical protein
MSHLKKYHRTNVGASRRVPVPHHEAELELGKRGAQ